MRRLLPVLVFACAAPVAAQDAPPPSLNNPNVEQGKPVKLTGCLAGGPSSYTLSETAATAAAHEGAARPVGVGASTAVVSYSLTPREGVELKKHVGSTVEITGFLLPPNEVAGEAPEPARVKPGEGGAAGERKTAPRRETKDRAGAAASQPDGASVIAATVAVTDVRMFSPTCR